MLGRLSATGRVSAAAVAQLRRGLSSAAAASTAVKDVKKVGVVGFGLMGHGIVQAAAQSGIDVVALESNEAALDHGRGMIEQSLTLQFNKSVKKGKASESDKPRLVDGVLDRVHASVDKTALSDCDLVIEAIIENMDIKRQLFSDLAQIVKPEAIFATNTSSFQVSSLADVSGRPDRLVGLHFFNPVQLMQLVEVVRTDDTSDEVFEAAMEFGRKIGKSPVACRDTPGFIVNRLLVPYMAEAMAMLDRGDANAKDIDTAMRLGAGYPMGPLTLADYVGLDTCLYILKGWVEKYPDSFFIPKNLERMVEAGKLGRKSGEGFYKWQGNKVVE